MKTSTRQLVFKILAKKPDAKPQEIQQILANKFKKEVNTNVIAVYKNQYGNDQRAAEAEANNESVPPTIRQDVKELKQIVARIGIAKALQVVAECNS